jgi:hypothetical protein
VPSQLMREPRRSITRAETQALNVRSAIQRWGASSSTEFEERLCGPWNTASMLLPSGSIRNAAPASESMRASLTFVPADGDEGERCDAARYESPRCRHDRAAVGRVQRSDRRHRSAERRRLARRHTDTVCDPRHGISRAVLTIVSSAQPAATLALLTRAARGRFSQGPCYRAAGRQVEAEDRCRRFR